MLNNKLYVLNVIYNHEVPEVIINSNNRELLPF